MAEVSVLDTGADPTGVNDSTVAFQKAQTAAAGGTVKIPRGDYRILPDQGNFLWWATRWIGESHTNYPNRCSRILPYGPGGNVLVNLPGKGYIESLIIDCENIVQTGLHVKPGHASYLRDVTIYNARDYGAKFIGSTLTAYGVGVTHSVKGLLLQGCNGSNFIAPWAAHCWGVGIEVQGGAVDPAVTTLSGGLTIYGASADFCGEDGQSPLIWFRGVEGGFYQLYYLEGSADAMWLSDNTHNATFIGTRAVIGGKNVLLRLQGARMCTFVGFTAPGENITTNRVIVDANKSYENEFYNMSRESRLAANPSGIMWEDGSATWTAYERDGRLQSSGPPTIGRWERGQIIENVLPTSKAPQGWVCVDSSKPDPNAPGKFTPGIWKPLAAIG